LEKSGILKVSKRLDASSVGEFKVAAVSLISSPDMRGLVLDFSETAFLDSAGLGALVSILKNVSQSGGKRLALASLSPHVRQIFELTKLYRLFEIYNNAEEAATELDS